MMAGRPALDCGITADWPLRAGGCFTLSRYPAGSCVTLSRYPAGVRSLHDLAAPCLASHGAREEPRADSSRGWDSAGACPRLAGTGADHSRPAHTTSATAQYRCTHTDRIATGHAAIAASVTPPGDRDTHGSLVWSGGGGIVTQHIYIERWCAALIPYTGGQLVSFFVLRGLTTVGPVAPTAGRASTLVYAWWGTKKGRYGCNTNSFLKPPGCRGGGLGQPHLSLPKELPHQRGGSFPGHSPIAHRWAGPEG